jgi:hypothetical protein
MAVVVAEAGAAVVELGAAAAVEEVPAVVTAVIQETVEEDISLPFFLLHCIRILQYFKFNTYA